MDFREIIEFLKDSIVYIIIVIVIILFLTFGFSFQKVVGNSMVPTYENKDVLLLSKIGVKLFKIDRNDIIAFSTDSGSVYIKRIIAIPGDTVYVSNNQLYVNDNIVNEDYLEEDILTEDFKFANICNVDGCEDGVIPEDYYFVLGDNRVDSVDSRFKIIGLVKKENIIGKVVFRIFPLF